MRLTLTGGQKDVRTLEEVEVTPSELTEFLGTFEVGEKEGQAVIPATFNPCPPSCHNAGQAKRVDCGGDAMHRLGANVATMTMLGVDIDHVTQERLDQILAGLQQRGFRFWCWHTHSHNPPDDARARVLIPFLTPLPLQHARQWSKVAWPALMKFAGFGDVTGDADQACKDPARVYYTPRKPTEDAVRESDFNDGEPLDWRPVLGDALVEVAKALPTAPAAPPDEERPVDRGEVMDRLRRLKPGPTKTLVKNVLEGRAPVRPPAERRAGEPSRYQAWRTVTGALAAVAEDWESTEGLVEILRAGHAYEVNDSPQDHTEWDVIVGLFESARAGMPAYRAQRAAEQAAQEEVFKRTLARLARQTPLHLSAQAAQAAVNRSAGAENAPAQSEQQPVVNGSAHTSAGEGDPIAQESVAALPTPVPVAELSDEDLEWTRELTVKMTDDVPKMELSAHNAWVILKAHPDWRGVLRLNAMGNTVEMHEGPFEEGVRTLRDADGPRMADWLAKAYGFTLPDGVVWARALRVADDNRYNPLQDYINGLRGVWDGEDRLETGLVRYFGSPTAHGLAAYHGFVFRKFMVQAIARGLEPGCKADVMLELEGMQGRMKSMAVEILGGEFFSNAKITFDSNKDSLIALAGVWFYEVGELEGMTKSEVAAQKAFLSTRIDQYRPPYGRSQISVPRTAVFIGTTNDSSYLQDPTGNRRHWPVECGTVDVRALRADRDQLFAQALNIYLAAESCEACPKSVGMRCEAHSWWLEPEQQAIATEQTMQRVAADPIAERIVRAIVEKPIKLRKDFLSTDEICELLSGDVFKPGLARQVANAMRSLGISTGRRGSARGYVIPAEILNAPQGALAAVLVRFSEKKAEA